MITKIALLAGVSILFLLPPRVRATPIQWTLSDVRFQDGSVVSGTFTFDPDAPIPGTGLTDFRISITGGSVLPNIVYMNSNPLTQLLVYFYTDSAGRRIEVVNAFGRRIIPDTPPIELLYLATVSFLTDAGGNIPLDFVASSGQVSNGEISYASASLLSGSFSGAAVAVPEPSGLAAVMGAIALGAWLALARQKFAGPIAKMQRWGNI